MEPAATEWRASDLIVRFGPFGRTTDRLAAVIEKARLHEREPRDGVLAISVYRVPAEWRADGRLADFIDSVPTTGKWIWPSSEPDLGVSGFELVWNPTRETDRHHLIPFGTVDMRNEQVLDSVTKLVRSSGTRLT